MSRRRMGTIAATLAAIVLTAATASARPLYFDTFTGLYGFNSGDDLYACGVCHRRWEGTGGRNPYGEAIEQQLYLGKTITNAILDIEGNDTDLDGFTNVDELTNYGTLPGYSCSNFDLVINPPPNFQSLITPNIASCLEPLDLDVDPAEITFVTPVGTPETVTVALINNGTDFPVTISSIALLAGAHPSLSVNAPSVPFQVPVGTSTLIDVVFAPAITVFTTATLRVISDDPDESIIDLPISALGVVLPIAPPAQRAACLEVVDHQFQTYSRRHLKEWMRCYVDEVSGRVCDTGRRDYKAERAEQRLRSFVGGSEDQLCAGQGLTPINLGLPATCGGACDHIAVTTIAAFADCLVCRQEAAMSAALLAAVGTSPPSLPSNVASGQAAACQLQTGKALRKGILRIHHALGDCELANITAVSPADCLAQQAGRIADVQSTVNASVDRCRDTTALLGCPFGLLGVPDCLGTAALDIGSDLTNAAFGLGN